jgi:hypothetical protein
MQVRGAGGGAWALGCPYLKNQLELNWNWLLAAPFF